MPETKRPLKVFLCHAHIIPLWDADRDLARALYARLTKDSVDAWLDKAKFLPIKGFDTPFGCNSPD